MNIKRKSRQIVDEILTYCKKNPSIFKAENIEQVSIKIVFSDLRKRFTEFYRIRVDKYSTLTQTNNHFFYWVRIVKNKPGEILLDALEKQFKIMQELYDFFDNRKNHNCHLSCCKPIALLSEYHALISRECNGILFNKYLQRQIPVLNQKNICTHCYNCGVWLKLFHEFYKDNSITQSEMEKYLLKFQDRFKREPEKHMRYITNCHNDYSPRNIFVSENSVEVIDFVGVKKGFPEQDIIFFCNYIFKARFNFLYPLRLKKKMVQCFHRGYMSLDE